MRDLRGMEGGERKVKVKEENIGDKEEEEKEKTKRKEEGLMQQTKRRTR